MVSWAVMNMANSAIGDYYRLPVGKGEEELRVEHLDEDEVELPLQEAREGFDPGDNQRVEVEEVVELPKVRPEGHRVAFEEPRVHVVVDLLH